MADIQFPLPVSKKISKVHVMTTSHILLQVTCFDATESDFQNFRTNWTNFRTLSEFQDISGHFLKFQEFQEFQDRAQA